MHTNVMHTCALIQAQKHFGFYYVVFYFKISENFLPGDIKPSVALEITQLMLVNIFGTFFDFFSKFYVCSI